MQKAVHIIRHQHEWTEIWNGSNGEATIVCGRIEFLCGKEIQWVRFPDDKPSDKNISEKHIPTCKKCQKKRDSLKK